MGRGGRGGGCVVKMQLRSWCGWWKGLIWSLWLRGEQSVEIWVCRTRGDRWEYKWSDGLLECKGVDNGRKVLWEVVVVVGSVVYRWVSVACCSSGGYGVRSLPSQAMVGALCKVWAASIPEMVGYSAMDEWWRRELWWVGSNRGRPKQTRPACGWRLSSLSWDVWDKLESTSDPYSSIGRR